MRWEYGVAAVGVVLMVLGLMAWEDGDDAWAVIAWLACAAAIAFAWGSLS